MKDLFQYLVLGIGAGVAYGTLSVGLVSIYRATRILNFAQAAFAMAAAYLFVDFHHQRQWPLVVAVAATIAILMAFAVLFYAVVLRRLRNLAPLVSVMATVGCMFVLNAAITLQYGSVPQLVPRWLPEGTLEVADIVIPADRLWMLGLMAAITAGLYLFTRFTRFGLATVAVSENELGAMTIGWSPHSIASASWAIGAGLAAAAGIMIVPITGLQSGPLSLLVIPALAGALAGKLTSYSWAAVGGLLVGMVQSVVGAEGAVGDLAKITGITEGVPFLAIVLLVWLQGQRIPVRGVVGERLPSLGTGIVRWRNVLVALAVALAAITFVLPQDWQYGTIASAQAALIILSLVALTGFAGQISLGQYAFAGIAALVAGQLVTRGWPFVIAVPVAVASTMIVGFVFAIPALRARGVTLAIVTLGLGVAVQAFVFSNTDYIGGFSGLNVGAVTIFGLDISAGAHPERYAIFCVLVLAGCLVLVANLRRSSAGRAMIAVRGNERAAVSVGVNVTQTKLWAFAISAGIAGLGGVLIGFQAEYITFEGTFGPTHSIGALLLSVLGGVGWAMGSLFGALFAEGGFISVLLRPVGEIDQWLALLSGLSTLAVILLHPDGLAGSLPHFRHMAAHLRSRHAHGSRAGHGGADRRQRELEELVRLPDELPPRVPVELEVTGLTVQFGGVRALDGLDLRVRSGEIVGLIGPNGAGKTTAIDAITGFVQPSAGDVAVSGESLRSTPVHRRASKVGRSFQAIELFEDITVLENLQVACDRRGASSFLRSLLGRDRPTLSDGARLAIRELQLLGELDRRPGDLAQGRRRLVGIARAVAAEPAILLLDEPAAGMSSAETRELRDLLRDLADRWGFGILLVEHDMGLVMDVCDRVVVLNFGRKIADGAPSDVRADPAVVEAYLGTTTDAPEAAGSSAAAVPVP